MEISWVGVVFLIVNAILLMWLHRRWAPLPLLIGACYMTLGQGLMIGPLNFTVVRILLAVGFVRALIRGERLEGELNGLDRLMIIWAVCALFTGFFHEPVFEALIFRLGLIYNACGIYFLLRVFCTSLDDLINLCRITAILIIPLSVVVLFEKSSGHNYFSVLGGVSKFSELRGDEIRAQGPFAHPILLGTVGAVCFPLMIGIWKKYRKTALLGSVACAGLVTASSSSGPILSFIVAVVALFGWYWRKRMTLICWCAILSYLALELIMIAPAYYIIARIDLTGSSTGWHRAFLIESALAHLSEWWLVGTDYTRHWIEYGVGWSEKHVDITNHFLQMGVYGGIPLMLLFIAILLTGCFFIGRCIKQEASLNSESRIMVWSFGASLFTHTVTFLSISYFDQTIIFLYLTLAAISSIKSEVFEINKLEKTKSVKIDRIGDKLNNRPEGMHNSGYNSNRLQ